MGMQSLKHFLLDAAGAEPIAHSPCEPLDFGDRFCVIATQATGGAVHRADRLYSCEDADLMASELNREWPSIQHWAAPATADEIRAHVTQAARLMRSSSGERSWAAQTRRHSPEPVRLPGDGVRRLHLVS
jgi:hypothetical protein